MSDDNIMLDGMDLKEGGAKAAFDQQGLPIVTLELKDADKFAEITVRNCCKASSKQCISYLA